MNVVQGITATGTIINTEDNYGSIYGNALWLDGWQRITQEAGRVAIWGDKSPYQTSISRRAGTGNPTRPSYTNNVLVKSANISEYLTSTSKNYKFLNDGSKFGIYIIWQPVWSLLSQSSVPGAISTSNAAGTGLQGIFGTSQSMGRFGYILRGGAASSSRTIGNLLNDQNSNYSPSGVLYAASFVNFGQTKGIQIRYGTKVVDLAPFFPTLAEYPQGNNFNFNICNGADGTTINLAQVIVYNWGQLPDNTVIDYDIRARNLQAKDKLQIQQLLL